MRPTSSPRSPTPPTPAVCMEAIGRTPRRRATSSEITVRSAPGVEQELLPPAVDLARDDDLVAPNPDRHRPDAARRRRVDVERHAALEGLEEPDLGAGPAGFLAAVLVGEEIDVARERPRRLVELAQALVNRGERVMELRVSRGFSSSASLARRSARRRAGCAPRATGRGRAGRGAAGHRRPARAVVRRFGFLETPDRPEGVAAHGR